MHAGNERHGYQWNVVGSLPPKSRSPIPSTLTQSLAKSPTPTDSLAKKREDVNKIVTDLLGPSASAPSPRDRKSPEPEASGEEKAMPISVSPRKRAVKLVVDTMAPININPRVSYQDDVAVSSAGITCTYMRTCW